MDAEFLVFKAKGGWSFRLLHAGRTVLISSARTAQRSQALALLGIDRLRRTLQMIESARKLSKPRCPRVELVRSPDKEEEGAYLVYAVNGRVIAQTPFSRREECEGVLQLAIVLGTDPATPIHDTSGNVVAKPKAKEADGAAAPRDGSPGPDEGAEGCRRMVKVERQESRGGDSGDDVVNEKEVILWMPRAEQAPGSGESEELYRIVSLLTERGEDAWQFELHAEEGSDWLLRSEAHSSICKAKEAIIDMRAVLRRHTKGAGSLADVVAPSNRADQIARRFAVRSSSSGKRFATSTAFPPATVHARADALIAYIARCALRADRVITIAHAEGQPMREVFRSNALEGDPEPSEEPPAPAPRWPTAPRWPADAGDLAGEPPARISGGRAGATKDPASATAAPPVTPSDNPSIASSSTTAVAAFATAGPAKAAGEARDAKGVTFGVAGCAPAKGPAARTRLLRGRGAEVGQGSGTALCAFLAGNGLPREASERFAVHALERYGIATDLELYAAAEEPELLPPLKDFFVPFHVFKLERLLEQGPPVRSWLDALWKSATGKGPLTEYLTQLGVETSADVIAAHGLGLIDVCKVKEAVGKEFLARKFMKALSKGLQKPSRPARAHAPDARGGGRKRPRSSKRIHL